MNSIKESERPRSGVNSSLLNIILSLWLSADRVSTHNFVDLQRRSINNYMKKKGNIVQPFMNFVVSLYFSFFWAYLGLLRFQLAFYVLLGPFTLLIAIITNRGQN